MEGASGAPVQPKANALPSRSEAMPLTQRYLASVTQAAFRPDSVTSPTRLLLRQEGLLLFERPDPRDSSEAQVLAVFTPATAHTATWSALSPGFATAGVLELDAALKRRTAQLESVPEFVAQPPVGSGTATATPAMRVDANAGWAAVGLLPHVVRAAREVDASSIALLGYGRGGGVATVAHALALLALQTWVPLQVPEGSPALRGTQVECWCVDAPPTLLSGTALWLAQQTVPTIMFTQRPHAEVDVRVQQGFRYAGREVWASPPPESAPAPAPAGTQPDAFAGPGTAVRCSLGTSRLDTTRAESQYTDSLMAAGVVVCCVLGLVTMAAAVLLTTTTTSRRATPRGVTPQLLRERLAVALVTTSGVVFGLLALLGTPGGDGGAASEEAERLHSRMTHLADVLHDGHVQWDRGCAPPSARGATPLTSITGSVVWFFVLSACGAAASTWLQDTPSRFSAMMTALPLFAGVAVYCTTRFLHVAL